MTAPDFTLIETFRFEPETGFLRWDLHEARLETSARALGFPLQGGGLARALEAVRAQASGSMRVRAELFPDGRIVVTSAPFTPLPEGQIWRLAIARTRLLSSDPLLRHKTSRRDHYTAARDEYPASEADEVLLLNEKDEVCEGTITSLFVESDDGHLLTPPLSSGCLAGVLRSALLASGKARECRLMQRDLTLGRLFVGNSLRGLIPALLIV